jgi:hypothetical protein
MCIELTMPKCYFCRAETQLFSNGIPICVKCSEEKEPEQKPQQTKDLKEKEPKRAGSAK